MRLRLLWMGHDRGTVVVGRRFWLAWDCLPHLDVRIRVEPRGAEPDFAVRAVWIESTEIEPPHDRVASSDLRALALRGLEKALQSPVYAAAVRQGAEDEDAPDLDPQVTDGMGVRQLLRRTTNVERFVIEPPATALQLEGLEATRRTDEFYEGVMEAYGWALVEYDKPAQAVADVNGVPVSTVHRWMKEAKRRRSARAGSERPSV